MFMFFDAVASLGLRQWRVFLNLKKISFHHQKWEKSRFFLCSVFLLYLIVSLAKTAIIL